MNTVAETPVDFDADNDEKRDDGDDFDADNDGKRDDDDYFNAQHNYDVLTQSLEDSIKADTTD
eukprot:12601375-Heterocapsa_arctica.AAC.1